MSRECLRRILYPVRWRATRGSRGVGGRGVNLNLARGSPHSDTATDPGAYRYANTCPDGYADADADCNTNSRPHSHAGSHPHSKS